MNRLEKLRAAYLEYRAARQARYDELMGDWTGKRESAQCFDKHKSVVAQMDAEQCAPVWPEDGHAASCDVFLLNSSVVDKHRVKIEF